jgi:chromosome segregation ATPase
LAVAVYPGAVTSDWQGDEDDPGQEGIRARGEQAVGDLAQALLDNPMFNGALSAAFGARERAIEAQRAAMEALNLPSADEVERLERRLRSLSHRLESVEEQIDSVARDVSAIRRRLDNEVSVGADQSRLQVED